MKNWSSYIFRYIFINIYKLLKIYNSNNLYISINICVKIRNHRLIILYVRCVKLLNISLCELKT